MHGPGHSATSMSPLQSASSDVPGLCISVVSPFSRQLSNCTVGGRYLIPHFSLNEQPCRAWPSCLIVSWALWGLPGSLLEIFWGVLPEPVSSGICPGLGDLEELVPLRLAAFAACPHCSLLPLSLSALFGGLAVGQLRVGLAPTRFRVLAKAALVGPGCGVPQPCSDVWIPVLLSPLVHASALPPAWKHRAPEWIKGSQWEAPGACSLPGMAPGMAPTRLPCPACGCCASEATQPHLLAATWQRCGSWGALPEVGSEGDVGAPGKSMQEAR